LLESKEWKRQLPRYVGLPPAGPSFYVNVFHPDFNFDPEEVAETVNRFDVHTKAVETGVHGLRNVFAQIRQARVGERQSHIALTIDLIRLKCRDVESRAPPIILTALSYHN
jgi:sorting nexin-9/18/33